MAENTFYIKINKTNFEYDIHALLKAFYPEKDVKVVTPESTSLERECENHLRAEILFSKHGASMNLEGISYEWQSICEVTEKRFKDGFKAFFYKSLQQHTGKSLPWGNLTGIRPTKIAYGMLDEGKSHEEIMDFLCREHFVSRKKAALSIDIAEREREILRGIHLNNDSEDNTGYSLYIGIPFCPTTCLYCSFTSYGIAAYRKTVNAYIDCLIKEMTKVSEMCRHKILDSVYIGGGTPTTLDPGQLDRLLCALKELFPLEHVKEFTVEAGRADSITKEKLEILYKHGVERISVNPQTMKQETLDMIGRRASVSQVLEAYAMARETGFDNINMDLILGLPGEDALDVQRTIDQVVSLAPDSLTVHSLAIKRASRMNQWIQENGISLLNNTEETMQIAAEGAGRLGMKPYYLYRQKNMSGNFENVGYAKPGKYGLYNILIMEEVQSIVALGAGSITKRVYPDGRIERCENVKDPALYIEEIDEMIERKHVLLND
ncbi:MAG: coproporphyrinogen dehydrogenase HemZ [Bacteroidales bacterium]|nr:coproporphyrinogen dehydrogenase HemZ [Lachnoclostridium sp.]MCM1384873.1 coproporphyrinogen dehydrogenase HemZ [Lachnoclostridium sp.]MCM1465778.1 coproporphyrinogen dehydrogenase HemZ [Bacteroidales bacterium]